MKKRKQVVAKFITFHCDWLGKDIAVPIQDVYMWANCDPCGRFDPEITGQFDCPCGKSHRVEIDGY